MKQDRILYATNKTTNFFRKLSKILYLFGIQNVWFEKVKFSDAILKFFDRFNQFVNVCLITFLVLELSSFFTQRHLTEKQNFDRTLFCFAHILFFFYNVSIEYYKDVIKVILHKLAISLKEIYNNEDVENRMIRKAVYSAFAYCCSVSIALISYGFDGLMQVIREDGTFTTVITAWPDVQDRSACANIARIINYILWWMLMFRISAVYFLIISLITCLSHQWINLQKYFCSLGDIFKKEDFDQYQREKKYEECFKLGVKLHVDTLWCTKQSQLSCSGIFSGQILINVLVFCLLMLQMANSERTLMKILPIVSTTVALLISTGFFMWNAGDVTVEATLVPNAMYSSGWENCRGDFSVRVRHLIVIAMSQGQIPVVLRGFSIIELSYNSYLSIVKSSYSVFSILY